MPASRRCCAPTSRELDYHADRRHDTRHAVVAIGCDAQAGVVWVVDRCFADPQRCTLASLAAARASRGWPEPVRHGLLRLRRPARLADPQGGRRAPRSTRVVHGMRHPRANGHPHVRSGLAAIDALADAWPQLPELAGPRLGETLAALRFRIRDGGTGGALYRSLQARFEHDAAALLGSAQLGSRGARVRRPRRRLARRSRRRSTTRTRGAAHAVATAVAGARARARAPPRRGARAAPAPAPPGARLTHRPHGHMEKLAS